MRVEIIQDGNHVTLRYEGGDIRFDVEGVDLPPFDDISFAIWMLLPLAMQRGEALHIAGTVDPDVRRNAETLSEIWTNWVPEEYQPVAVSADRESIPSASPGRHPSIHLFSGGVDSTFSIFQEAQSQPQGHALTVHGLDFWEHETEPFRRLMAKTQPFLDMVGRKRVVVRTNISRHVGHLALTYSFILCGSLFMLRSLFAEGRLAPDFTPMQDFIAFPYGMNQSIKDCFFGSDFAMRQTDATLSRLEKIEALYHSDIDLSTMSFCGKKDIRPENCGRCKKCVRTKAMFVAATGEVPPVFLDNSWDREVLSILPTVTPIDLAFFTEIHTATRKRDRFDLMPGLDDMMKREIARRRRRRTVEKAYKKASKLLRL